MAKNRSSTRQPSLRQTLVDLGSPSDIVRNMARERALAAGPECLLKALVEEQRHRHKRQWWWKRSWLVYLLLLAMPSAIEATPTGAIVGLLLVVATAAGQELYGSARRWQQEAAALLTHFEGPEAMIGLIGALDYVTGSTLTNIVQPSLMNRFDTLRPEDNTWLTHEHRQPLFRRLQLGQIAWEHVTTSNSLFTIALCRVAAVLGATEVITRLEGILALPAYSRGQKAIQSAASEALNALQPIAELQKPGERLLRPAHGDADTLLQPAMGTESSAPDALLRPARIDGSME